MKATDIVASRWSTRFMNRRFASVLGRNGVTADKREGDGASPLGVHRIVGMLYRPDRLAASQLPDWALPTGLGDLWSDDPRDEDYNLLVRAPHGFSHESLRRADPLYDLILITDWNWPEAQPGRGSAIFVHVWRCPRYPTAGCLAMDLHDLLWIANRITHQTRLIIRN